MLYNETNLYHYIKTTVGQGDPTPYALLWEYNERHDYYRVLSFNNTDLTKRMNRESFLKLDTVYMFGLNEEIDIDRHSRTESLIIFDDIDRKFYYGVSSYSLENFKLRRLLTNPEIAHFYHHSFHSILEDY